MNWKPGWIVGAVCLLASPGCGDDEAIATTSEAGGGGAGAALAGGASDGAAPVAAGGRGGAPTAGWHDGGAPACPQFASGTAGHDFGPGQSTGQSLFPDPVLGPPHGGGCCNGSLDVVSLGNGGWVVLTFGETVIVDGPGPDFIVFENAFFIGGNESFVYAELATIEVSSDGETWSAFPCDAALEPFDGCAGAHPVYANAAENDISPLDPTVAGGDAFDLADVGLDEARYVRITDRLDAAGEMGVFDLDAVSVVNGECRAP